MKTIKLCMLFWSLSLAAAAQNNAELKTLVQQSFTYFPRLQELEKSNEITEMRIDVAKSGYLPTINGTASYNYINPIGEASFPVGPNETRTIQFQPHNNYNAVVNVNQVIWDFGKTQAQIAKAKTDLRAGVLSKEAAQLQLASQVATIYYSMIYLRKAIGVQDSVIRFYERNKKIVEGRVRQGDALHIDLTNTQNNIEQEKSRRVEFVRQLERQKALLNYTSGTFNEPTLSDFDFTAEAVIDQSSNPDLLALDQRILSAESDVKQAQRNQLPTLNFVANAGYRNGYQPDINDIRFNYLAGVTLNVPIFQGKRLYQHTLLSRKSLELNQVSKNNLSSTLKKDLESSVADETAYTEQIEHAANQIAANEEALRLTRVRYEKGVSTFLELDYASTNLQRALLNKLQFEYQRCLSEIEQSRLVGRKFWE